MVFARYALVAAVAVFLLTGLGLSMVRNRWARLTLVVMLILEVLPAPMASLPFPPPVHPAFEWLKQQSMAGEGIADLIAAHPSTPELFNEGETVFATLYHGKPTVAGASSIWPADIMFLYDWLASHQHSFWNLDMVPILRFYGVRYILLHMRSEMEPTILEEARSNQELRFVNCFPAVPVGGTTRSACWRSCHRATRRSIWCCKTVGRGRRTGVCGLKAPNWKLSGQQQLTGSAAADRSVSFMRGGPAAKHQSGGEWGRNRQLHLARLRSLVGRGQGSGRYSAPRAQ